MKPVIDGSIIKLEERQRLARERREERDKQHAFRESEILEKQKKAKLQYEKQIEEKQIRLKEQKLKEQLRRAAVERKRQQKIEEEKVHYEAVLNRTLERSQRLETKLKRGTRDVSAADSNGKTAGKHSAALANLKTAASVINKRLSSSRAPLSSPSMSTTKRSSSVNRFKNKVPLNSEASEEPVSKSSQMEQKAPNDSPCQAPKAPVLSHVVDRSRTTATSSTNNFLSEAAQKPEAEKEAMCVAGRHAVPSVPDSSPSLPLLKLDKRPPSLAAIRQKPQPPSWRPLSAATASKPAPNQLPSLMPNVLSIPKNTPDVDWRPKGKLDETAGQEQRAPPETIQREIPAASKTKDEATSSIRILPELQPSVMGPSAASPLHSRDFWSTSSAARKLFLGYNPLSVSGTSTGFPAPFQTGCMQSSGISSPRQISGHSQKGPRTSFSADFAVAAEGQRAGTGIGRHKSFGAPGAYQTGAGPAVTSLGGRLPNAEAGMRELFVLEKLLQTFQTVRCSVDNISQELRVLNTHLASLARYFELSHPAYIQRRTGCESRSETMKVD